MKSFIEPGNTLTCLRADENRGIIHFDEERDYHLEYVLRDFKGNEARYPFTVTARNPFTLTARKVDSGSSSFVSYAVASLQLPILRWNRTNSYSRPGVQLIVPYGFVAADASFSPVVTRQPDDYSDVYQFAQASLPLMRDAELSIYARQGSSDVVNTFDPSKLYITDENGRFMGGDYHDGWVIGRVRELASRYQVAYDDQPPTVNPISLSGDVLRLSVIDGLSGIASWTATVDDRFIVFDAIEKSSTYACELRESWLRRSGKDHRLRFEVTDNRQNTRIYETTFTY
jgi:hypothetical protein